MSELTNAKDEINTFAQKLRLLRKKRKLKQKDVSNRVGISYRAYQKYEGEGSKPREPETYRKLAETLGCSLDYLMDDNIPIDSKDKPIYDDAYDPAISIPESDTNGSPYTCDTDKPSDNIATAQEFAEKISAMFAGGKISKESMDDIMLAINKAYWMAKEKYIELHKNDPDKKTE